MAQVIMPISPLIGVVTRGEMRHEFVRSLFQSYNDWAGIVIHPSGPYLDAARNYVFDKWLKEYPDREVFVFIDDDIEFTPDDLNKIVTACCEDRPIVSGIYMNPFPYGLRPVAFRYSYDDSPSIQGMNFTPYLLEELYSEPRDEHGLISVGCVGAGFMAIHRSLLDKMLQQFGYPMPWFAEEVINGVHMGEDMTFCARASYCGMQVSIHPEVRVSHVKLFKFNPDVIFIPDQSWAVQREEAANVV